VLSEKHGFADWDGFSKCYLGYALAQLGHAIEGAALIRTGLDLLAEKTPLGTSYHLATLALAEGLAGNLCEALTSIEKAIATNEEQLVVRPEIYRIRGELRLQRRQPELAEADFRESSALARKISAKSWELRATISLARLLRNTDRRDEAHTMLAEIYNWFTEGLDTADLKEAKALLYELGT
jgi:hypothetical protein